ncbi:tyrosine-type recombinase/integrase [Roseomonas sp. GCM10028921]
MVQHHPHRPLPDLRRKSVRGLLRHGSILSRVGASREPGAVQISIDEWAWRRRQRYGTLICDLERRRVLDLLPNCEPTTVRAWLASHPGLTVVARDRAGGFAGAVTAAAPGAIQVADRWHLMENASAAFLGAVRSVPGPIRRALGAGTINPDLLSAAERLQYEGYLRQREESTTIRALARDGASIKGIVRRTGRSRKLVRVVAREATSVNTRRAYRAAWADFTAWYEANGREALPAAPETVGTYLAARASSLRAATLALRLVAIGQAHRLAGHRMDAGHPAIRKTLQGIRAVHGSAPRKKDAAVAAVIRDMADVLAKRPGLRAMRDRALLLVGFAAALRRSELVAFDVQDLAFVSEGLVVTIRRGRTDQEGRGVEIGIPFGISERTCPVLALRTWLYKAAIQEGAVFRSVNRHDRLGTARLSDRDVARVVKACVEAAGYDPTAFAGHSLRSGFITSAARAGVAERAIQNQSRHKSLPVLRGYIRRGSLFVDNAAARVGLCYSAVKDLAHPYCGHPLSRSSGSWESRRRSVRSLGSM